MADHSQTPLRGDNPQVLHEESDVNVKVILLSGGAIVVTALVFHVLMWGLFKVLATLERGRTTERLSSIAQPANANLPPEPRLQPFPDRLPGQPVRPPNLRTPAVDMKVMTAAENETLSTYGWNDRTKGVVRIPVGRAMEIVLQRGFAVRPPVEAPAAPAAPEVPAVLPAAGEQPAPGEQPAGQTPGSAPQQPPAPAPAEAAVAP